MADNETEGHVWKNFVVRHEPKYSRTWQLAGSFETLQEALAEFDVLHQLHPDERVWVVELPTDQAVADSHPRPRRR